MSDSPEHKHIEKICNAADAKEEEVMEDAIHDSLNLFWPFIRQKHDFYRKVHTAESGDGLDGKKQVLKIQVKTVDRRLQETFHYT